jgi:hypothetical protein
MTQEYSSINMDEKCLPRRGIIKGGLVLLMGALLFGLKRMDHGSNAERKGARVTGLDMVRHCTEGTLLEIGGTFASAGCRLGDRRP